MGPKTKGKLKHQLEGKDEPSKLLQFSTFCCVFHLKSKNHAKVILPAIQVRKHWFQESN